MNSSRHLIKRRDLRDHNVQAMLTRLEPETYELTVSEKNEPQPLVQRMLFAHSRRDAVQQFSDWLNIRFPKAS
jgi:hypothetical protein